MRLPSAILFLLFGVQVALAQPHSSTKTLALANNIPDTTVAREKNLATVTIAMQIRQEDSIKYQKQLSAVLFASEKSSQRNNLVFIIILILGASIFSIIEYRRIKTQKRLNATIRKLVGEQEDTIALRTDELRATNERLVELIHYSAHNMREPLTRVMGAMNIRELLTTEEFDQEIWPQIGKALLDLDNSIKLVVNLAEEVIEG